MPSRIAKRSKCVLYSIVTYSLITTQSFSDLQDLVLSLGIKFEQDLALRTDQYKNNTSATLKKIPHKQRLHLH